ncbi:hypothetical protein COU58_00925 [Candidatus Pacearchaeota archaeon CG10_big_fil_rev_8_21_14_0_10_32_42]|nr:MAG: hypothetical protein COU58_00925 [Candidatus Pacearchaeota archaeon CG10_big_fil_rev_8_21_14_0_10_32_42]
MKKGLIILWVVLSLILILFSLRLTGRVELDDVTPEIPCENELIEKSDVLWIIPNFENKSIAENKTWCQKILSLNKTLGMHGIEHNYMEFSKEITTEELQRGREIFKECFEDYPLMFKPPQLAISSESKKVVKESGMKLMRGGNQLIHKVYHCNDSDIIKNSFIYFF